MSMKITAMFATEIWESTHTENVTSR